MLELEQGYVDAAQFELLVEEGQVALARGAARGAADRFREGLALCYGRAFADVLDIARSRSRADVSRSQLTAFEGRIEAELTSGSTLSS